ncbi:hypothetical protein WH299_22110 [Pseudomonas sp. MYb541]|uniref:hypothetical protein n=1 Tax=Pseudomonas sp. MYb541 TaxID=2745402 RepID=UPI00309A0742
MSKPKSIKSKPKKSQAGKVAAGSEAVLAFDGPRVIRAQPDGLVPAQYYFNNLECEIVTPWTFLPEAGETHYVVPMWDDHSAAPVEVLPALRLDGPLTPEDFPYPFEIPQAFLLRSAIVDLRFRVYLDPPPSQNYDTSEPTLLRIDRDAPGVGGPLPPAIFPVDPITDAYLGMTPLVPMEVPGGYLGREIGDEILMYFSDMNTLPTGAPAVVSPPLTSATGQIFVNVPNTVFQNFPGAAFVFCFYRLRDRAGNLNPEFSLVAQAALEVGLPAPTYMRPRFPQADSEPIVNPNRYMTCACTPKIWFGVEIRIDPNTGPGAGIQHGDLVVMHFQGYGQALDVNPLPDIVDTQSHIWDGVADALGYSFWILDVERLIRPLKDRAGGEANYRVYRGGRLNGRSASRFARFDRVVSSAPPTRYCWIDGNAPEP